MTTATSSATWSVSTQAAAQALAASIMTLMQGIGMSQTSDTGQLVPTSIASSITSANTSIGYWVYSFPDNASFASRPIFIRLELRTDSGARPWVLCSAAGSTDGAGTLGSPSWAGVSGGSVAYQTPLTSYASYSDGTFCVVFGANAWTVSSTTFTNTCCGGLIVDRARNAFGVAQSNGYLVEFPNINQGYSGSRSMYGSASPAGITSWIPSLVPSAFASSSSSGANVNVFRHYMMVPGVMPAVGTLSYFYAEFGALTPFTANVLGSNHIYLPMGKSLCGWSSNYNWNDNSICGAIRWE